VTSQTVKLDPSARSANLLAINGVEDTARLYDGRVKLRIRLLNRRIAHTGLSEVSVLNNYQN
jgi:hypothetical protein